jgi:hypothetical protein
MLALLLALTWTPPTVPEVAALGASVALIWVDVGQTRDVAYRYPGHWHEAGFVAAPFLGAHPSMGKIFWVGGVLPTVLLTGAFIALPSKWWRYALVGGVIAGEGYTVTMNHLDGFRIRF